MSEDLDAARHLFGYAVVALNYFQVFGAMGAFLVVFLSVRRWWDV